MCIRINSKAKERNLKQHLVFLLAGPSCSFCWSSSYQPLQTSPACLQVNLNATSRSSGRSPTPPPRPPHSASPHFHSQGSSHSCSAPPHLASVLPRSSTSQLNNLSCHLYAKALHFNRSSSTTRSTRWSWRSSSQTFFNWWRLSASSTKALVSWSTRA